MKEIHSTIKGILKIKLVKNMVFIEKMTNALIMCLGNDGSQLARKMMIKQLRIFAPEHFQKKDMSVNTGSGVSV